MGDINLGAFRLNPRGQLDPNAKYKFFDYITYNGNSYVNINDDEIDGVATQGQLPTMEEGATKYYQLVAARGEKGDKADKYDAFLELDSNVWNYELSDKVKLITGFNANKAIEINNVYDGCCGVIITESDIFLPPNSDVSIDYNYIKPLDNEYYVYTFIYDGSRKQFIWNRSVYTNA